MTESNVGKWTPWWEHADPSPLGPEDSYRLGAAWLHGLPTEDWGCGTGWFRNYIGANWTGVDGTGGKKAHEPVTIADLTTYQHSTPGLFMRHVLEHNEDWRSVLRNALESFQKRMVLVIFTPEVETTHVFNRVAELGNVVEIAFNFADIEGIIWNYQMDRQSAKKDKMWWSQMVLPERGPFKAESVWFFEKGRETA